MSFIWKGHRATLGRERGQFTHTTTQREQFLLQNQQLACLKVNSIKMNKRKCVHQEWVRGKLQYFSILNQACRAKCSSNKCTLFLCVPPFFSGAISRYVLFLDMLHFQSILGSGYLDVADWQGVDRRGNCVMMCVTEQVACAFQVYSFLHTLISTCCLLCINTVYRRLLSSL